MNRYVIEFGGAMLAYVVLLPVSIYAYRAVDQDALRAIIAVAVSYTHLTLPTIYSV